jgi:hypothetical protein
MNPENVNKLLGNLSEQEVNKLAEILAVMQKIADTEREKVLPQDELLKRAETVKERLPEPPKNILLKFVRAKTERKIAKTEKSVKALKNKISKQERKRQKLENRIKKLKSKAADYSAANAFLEGLDTHGGFKTFLIERSDAAQERLQRQIKNLDIQVATANGKAENLQNKIGGISEKTEKLREKIQRINALDSLPGAAVLLFLADRIGVKEPESNITETAEKVTEIAETPEVFFSEEEIALATGENSPIAEIVANLNFPEADAQTDVSEELSKLAQRAENIRAGTVSPLVDNFNIIAAELGALGFTVLNEAEIFDVLGLPETENTTPEFEIRSQPDLLENFENGEDFAPDFSGLGDFEDVSAAQGLSDFAPPPASEQAQFVPPPNFEYEEQPVQAVPYAARQNANTNRQTAPEPPPVKKENDELSQHDPNVSDPQNELNPENANAGFATRGNNKKGFEFSAQRERERTVFSGKTAFSARRPVKI